MVSWGSLKFRDPSGGGCVELTNSNIQACSSRAFTAGQVFVVCNILLI